MSYASPYFAGRADVIAAVERDVEEHFAGVPGRNSTDPLIIAVTGGRGLGKSELALHLVQRLEHRFADGWLAKVLNGGPEPPVEAGRHPGHREQPFAPPRRRPRHPEKVLAEMLRLVDEPPQRDDLGVKALSAAWKAATRRRGLLVVLDDARDFEQIRPLLPEGPRNAVLITSSDALADAARHGARHYRHYPLGPLTPEEGAELLRRIAGERAADFAPEALREIAEQCQGHPLSISFCGTRLRDRGGWRPEQLLAELRSDRNTVLLGPAGVTAAFAEAFAECTAAERLLLSRFARVGLGSYTPWSAAALLGVGTRDARTLLDGLCDRYLLKRLNEEADGRFRYALDADVRTILQGNDARALGVPRPELLRWSARSLTRSVDRLLAGYVWLAQEAARTRAPQEWGFTEPDVPSAPPDPGLDLRVPERPDTWFESERHNLRACLTLAESRGATAAAWRLARAIAALCRAGRVYWQDWGEALDRCSAHALALGDRLAHGISLLDRAEFAGSQGRHTDAVGLARRARDEFAGGDVRWQARAARAIGVNLYRRGDRDEGESELVWAARVFGERREGRWHARTLCNLGELYRFRGDFERAQEHLVAARAEAAAHGDTDQAANAGLLLGEVLGHLGQDLRAWLILRDVLDTLEATGGADWYRARCLRTMGRLDPIRLRDQYDACDLLLDPGAEQARRAGWERYFSGSTLEKPVSERRRAELERAWSRGLHAAAERALGTENWPVYVRVVGGRPRWSAGAAARRLAADRAEWSHEAAVARVEEADDLLRRAGDAWGSHRTRLILGELLMRTDPDRGREVMEAAAEGFAALEDWWWHARALRHTAQELFNARRAAEARDKAERAKAGYERLSNLSGLLRTQVLLGKILGQAGDYRGARAELDLALERAREGHAKKIVHRALLDEVYHVRSTIIGDDPRRRLRPFGGEEA
ncbi:tetratricopeptide (TPR) repeat protein [Streptomonospora nanhaiensis]|uniref:Tetratricopeptide (TPR) repeat protein n=2 Tax=Streptomonospora nanhaiensis TaxID=1323731 RepID=A0A853BH62_9ACTN|nr:tetratricopeptide repeat protein [Streptomonospora nanhaiensis]NYI94719.1 tetratricopeptide (TPR) repeat protein [Streptomonospora nanhaiensis]